MPHTQTEVHLNHYFERHVCFSMGTSVRTSVHHKKLTLLIQENLLTNDVAYDSVIKKHTLGSPPDLPGLAGHPRGARKVKQKVGQMKTCY